MSDKPRLIEVAFPLKQASLASVHEKDVKHGHVSTLHIWPARRPLAASRAALLATLLPDPGDPEKRKALMEKIGGTVILRTVKTKDEDGNTFEEEREVVSGGVLAWGQENTPEMDEFRALIRGAYGGCAPKVIDPFAGGGAIPLEALRLGCEVTAADINPVAWFILKCTLEYPQKFAGKKWPLPDFVKQWPDFVADFRTGKVKKRKTGMKTHFTDAQQADYLHAAEPLEADLAWHVRAWGRWVLERARQDLAARYPVINGEPTVAYLWARTARDKQTAGAFPLLKTFWLCKKTGRRAALLPLPADDKKSVRFELLQEADLKQPAKVIESHPILAQWEVTADTLTEFLNKGTMNRAGVWSPLSGRPGMVSLTMEDLRRQGQQGLLDTQMTAVVVEKMTIIQTPVARGGFKKTHKPHKIYRLPVEAEISAAKIEPEDLEEAFRDIPFGIPNESLPPPGTLGFRIPLYGFKRWRDVFTPRQLMTLACFIRRTREAQRLAEKLNEELAEAIHAYLSLNVDRVANRSSTICMWSTGANKIEQTFARFALPMKWDFCESLPAEEFSGGYLGQLEFIAKFLEHSLSIPKTQSVDVECRSALADMNGCYDAIVTDPPYYDAIPYSDLMDFFYIWLKRCLNGVLGPDVDARFSQQLGPKWNSASQDGELIDDGSRFGGDSLASKASYEAGMAKAFSAGLAALKPDGRMFVVFANKVADAWETLVGGLIKGGAVVSASWPVQTEKAGGLRDLNRASLSSSVWIVCRKRPPIAQAGWEEKVLEEMRHNLFGTRETLGGRNILQYFFDLGIRGPDFIWAALGPALEAYSAHPFVKKTAGGILTVPEFLAEVRRLVLHFALGELPGFRDISQQTQGRGESLEIDPVTQYYLLHRAYFGLDPAPAGACIMYAQACGKSENELKLVWNVLAQGGKSKRGRPSNEEVAGETEEGEEPGETKGNEFTLVPWEQRAQKEDLGETRGGAPAPLIDRLHRLMKLFQQNRTSEVQQAYDNWGLANERAFPPLLQAIRELALHDRQDTERRLVEALATQFKLSRKQVVVDDGKNVVQELPLFDTAEIQQSEPKPVSYRVTTKKKKKS